MQIDDTVYVKTDADEPREGRILLIEPFSEGVMYLVALPEYPEEFGFNEKRAGMVYSSRRKIISDFTYFRGHPILRASFLNRGPGFGQSQL